MTVAAAPDARQLAADPLGTAPFPGKPASLRVYFDQSAHDALSKHASEDTSIEICGVLVGAWLKDQGGPYVHVSASIRGEAAASKNAEVTFTHQTWAKINERMDKEFTDRVIVGWYHTHPDFGIFLSNRDVFIHQHFFNAPGQVALVIDPIRREEGVFVWENGKPTLTPTHWIGSTHRASPRPNADAPLRVAAAAEHTGSVANAQPVRPAPSPPPLSSMVLYVAAAAGLVAAGYFAAAFNQQQQQTLVAQALAQQLYNKTASPETRRSLVEIRELLSQIGDESRKLTEPKKEGVTPLDPQRISAAINQRLALAGAELNRAVDAQSLTIEQQAAIDWFVAQRLQAAVDQNVKDLIARGVLTASKPAPDPAAKDAKPNPGPVDKPVTPADAIRGSK